MLSIGFLYLSSVQPSYGIKSKILLRKDSNSATVDNDWLKRQLYQGGASENVANEMQILSSFSLMKEVVEDLHLDINYYIKKKIGKEYHYDKIPFTIDSLEVLNNDAEKNTFKITILNNQQFELAQENYKEVFNFGKLVETATANFSVSYNGPFLTEGNRTMYFQHLPLESAAENYLTKLSINLIDPNSSIIELSLEDEIPERGIAILSRLIEKYQQFSNKEQNDIAQNTLQFILHTARS